MTPIAFKLNAVFYRRAEAAHAFSNTFNSRSTNLTTPFPGLLLTRMPALPLAGESTAFIAVERKPAS
jgi:hypothetical protein